MTLPIIPPVGSTGRYVLAPPYNSHAEDGIQYTCMAVRRLSDYLANNEEPLVDIYEKYEIESTYDADVEANVYIVSLQSATGHWLYLPASYILQYPNTDGVPYRSVMLVLSLPSMPVEHDFTDFLQELQDLTMARLGVASEARMVETSKPVQIDEDDHLNIQITRQIAITSQSLHQQLVMLQQQNAALAQQVAALEDYIITQQP